MNEAIAQAKHELRAATHAAHEALEAVSVLDDRESVGHVLKALTALYEAQGRVADLLPRIQRVTE